MRHPAPAPCRGRIFWPVLLLPALLLALTTGDATARQVPGGQRPPATPAAEPLPPDFEWAPWDSLLARHVTDGLVDYAGWRAGGTAELDALLAAMASWSGYEKATREQKMAFLMNAYNALIIRQVLANPGIESVKQIKGVFDTTKHRLPGGEFTLDGIEKTLLRALAGREDPAWHFGVVCASRGCPPLLAKAYRAPELSTDLAGRARLLLADPTKARYEEDGHILHLSELFRWYQSDFEFGDNTLVRWLGPYMTLGMAMKFASSEPEVRFLDFDWRLNETAPER